MLNRHATTQRVCSFVFGEDDQFPAGFSLTDKLRRMSSEPASIESLRVLYQSDDYIVVDKHWDIRIDSKMWYEKETVQMQLQHHFPQLADPSTYYGFRSVPAQILFLYASQTVVVFIFYVFFFPTGFVTSWIFPPAELFVSLSTKLLLVGLTAALRTAPSLKPT